MSEYAEMTNAEKRLEIHRRLGYNDRVDDALSKPVLNSLLGYLTGSFGCFPRLVDDLDRSPTKVDVQESVAVAVAEAAPEEWVSETMEGWTSDLDHTGFREFNSDEYEAILTAMDETGDQREWAGETREMADVHPG